MSAQASVAANLAAALLTGAWSLRPMARRVAEAWSRRERWQRPLVRQILRQFPPGTPPPAASDLTAFIRETNAFSAAWADACRDQRLPLGRIFCHAEAMAPAAPALSWNVPALTTPAQLADWLGVSLPELDWFADCQGRLRLAASGPIQHYRYRWLAGRRRQARLLEIPKARLKDLQRRILHGILNHIPPHAAAHGYRRGHSLLSYVTPHVGQPVVVHFDLRQFFPSIRAARVHAIFRTAGYPAAVARLLTGLCTNRVPAETLHSSPIHTDDGYVRLRSPHLPQGAPTSPALANLCAFSFDCRLADLSRCLGACYTRYADDLVFSGGELLERSLRRFQVMVCRLALEEGFEINTRKSRFMRQGVRQQVAGIVLNIRPNPPRAAFDELKAILTNCLRHGPQSQNRAGHRDFRAYLSGRLAYFNQLNPARAGRLRLIFDRIQWQP